MKRWLWILILSFVGITLLLVYLSLPEKIPIDENTNIEKAEGGIKANNVDETTPALVETSQQKLAKLGGDPNNKTNEPKINIITLGEEVREDSALLVNNGRLLHLDENLVETFGPTIFEESLNTFLKKESFRMQDGTTQFYEQKIKLSTNLEYIEYEDDSYLNGTNATGINPQVSDELLTYQISFAQDIKWNDLPGIEWWFFGRKYYVASVDPGLPMITMLKDPYKFILYENEKVQLAYPTLEPKTFAIGHIDETDATLIIDDIRISNVATGKVYYEKGIYFLVKEVTYSTTDASAMTIITSPQKLVFTGGEVRDDDQPIEGYKAHFTPEESPTDISTIAITWKTNEELFLSAVTPLQNPFFKNIILSMTRSSFDSDNELYTNVTISTISAEMGKVIF